MTARTVITLAAIVTLCPREAPAQSRDFCRPGSLSPPQKTNIHTIFDCIEALFSEAPAHLTVSSVPPGNGFALGGVLETETHFVSPAVRLPDIDIKDPDKQPDTGYVTLTDAELGIVGSTNGSWYTTGSFSWLPLHYKAVTKGGVTYQKLGPLLTHQVFGIQFYGTHRSIQNLSFYGEGSTSPATEYVFKQTETYAGSIARLPLTTWLTAAGQVEYRQISLPVTNNSLSVQNNFNEAAAPGLNAQPGFVHSALAFDTDQSWRSEARSPAESLTPAPNAPPPGLAKHDIIFRLENRAAYDWYTDTNTGHYSFGQFSFMGDESVHFGAVLLKYLDSKSDPGAFRFFRFVCGGAGHKEAVEKQGADGKPVKVTEASFKKDDVCDLGQLDVKTRFVFSQTAAGNVVPFYYQPTLGGSDLESRVTLRGYPDYRFRGNDLALVQIEYSKPLPVLDPVGAFAFYDGGSVAPAGQSLGMARYRQDGGLGASLRLQGKIVLRAWAAMGAGHGVHIGYNLEKLF